MTRLSISARFTLKDLPKNTPGIVGENIMFGRDRAVSLSVMLAMITKKTLTYYLACAETDELNSELDKFRAIIEDLKVIEEPIENDPQPRLPGMDGAS